MTHFSPGLQFVFKASMQSNVMSLGHLRQLFFPLMPFDSLLHDFPIEEIPAQMRRHKVLLKRYCVVGLADVKRRGHRPQQLDIGKSLI